VTSKREKNPWEEMAEGQSKSPPPLTEQEIAHQAGGGVSGEERKVKTINASVLKHLEKIYGVHAGKDDNKWHEEQVTTFLQHVQGESEKEAITKGQLVLADKAELDFRGFLNYMTSTASNIVGPPQVQDMSWPLSSYFISSSHNTYLTGNQLSSDSSADAYKNVLMRGCRCIEIDVWDGESEVSEESSADEAEPQAPKAVDKRWAQVQKLKDRMPESLVGRLEKSSLGKRLERYVERSNTLKATTSTSKDATGKPVTKPLHRAPTAPVEPRVLHGYTLTREVSFREVCVAIKDNAFAKSDLPLIVSLEVHCGAEQQEVMVKIIHEVWKELLLPEMKDTVRSLPSPADLRGRILVKVKYVPPSAAIAEDQAPSETSSGSDVAKSTEAVKTVFPPPPTAAVVTSPPKKPSKIIPSLSRLGIYTQGVSFKSLAQPEATMPTHVFSLSEKGVMEVHEKAAPELFHHNRHYLMRAYPSGLRIRSSNLDPSLFWRKGIQIVALNWQNWDEGMMLNEGMFAGTGGYVLKPEGKCSQGDNFWIPVN
jgi:hypothetical protein